jgi:23S rRNA (adenine-N6)-dimethyltransferase
MQQLPIAGIDRTRADLDQYFTPDSLAERMVAWGLTVGADHLSTPVILEPCAGQGAIVRAALGQGARVVAYEVDADHAAIIACRHREAIAEGRLRVITGDFFDYQGSPMADLAVTNPPYRWDRDFMSHILRYCPMAIALLRTVFANGVGRWKEIWAKHQLRRVAHLKRRPRFGGRFQPKIDFSVFDIGARPTGITPYQQPHTVQVSWW